MATATTVEARLNFLKKDPLYDIENSYELTYEPADGIAPTNMLTEKIAVRVENIRGKEQDLSLEKNGFTVLELKDLDPDSEHYYDDAFVKSDYFPKLSRAVQAFLKAERVQIFNYAVGIRLQR